MVHEGAGADLVNLTRQFSEIVDLIRILLRVRESVKVSLGGNIHSIQWHFCLANFILGELPKPGVGGVEVVVEGVLGVGDYMEGEGVMGREYIVVVPTASIYYFVFWWHVFFSSWHLIQAKFPLNCP